MTDKELRILDEMLTNLEIWSTWNKTFANEMIGICSKMRNLLADRKTEPTGYNLSPVDKDINVRSKDEPQTELVRVKYHCINCAENGSYKCSKCDGEMYYKYDKDEPQTEPLHTCSVNGRPYSECSSCEHFKCTADEPQTDCPWK